jgi:hypothetical protein
MNQNINPQISQVDENLKILRESWISAKPENKSACMSKIDAALDERLNLMNIRDRLLCDST